VVTIWALAEQHHCHGLKAACLDFLSTCSPTNLNAVLESEGFGSLFKSYPDVAMDLLVIKVGLVDLGEQD
jgi:speckle-type POZ protein